MNNRLISLLPFFLFTLLTYSTGAIAQKIHACVVMPGTGNLPSSPQEPGYFTPTIVQKAVALGRPNENPGNSNFWTAGSTVRVKFIGGSSYVRQRVIRYSQEWSRYANVDFSFVNSGTSDIRVSFVLNGSSWSMLGRQARAASPNQPTMNFGWLTDQTPEYEFRRTILHEFGHALGLLHEHQNPSGGIPWDEQAVYAFYQSTQGWDHRTTYRNVIARQAKNETQYSAYDPASIMHYPVDPRLTLGSYEVGLNTTISATDARFIAQVYPGRSSGSPIASSPSKPTIPVRTAPTDRPRPAEARPAVVTHEVTISNRLGEGQRAEVVELFVDGRKHLFELQQGRRSQQAIRLRLEPGVYPYRVSTASVYTVRKRVLEGSRYVERSQNLTVYGGGNGNIHVEGDGQLTFYGEYDREKRRMLVYLDEE